jgi:hypothetical protein
MVRHTLLIAGLIFLACNSRQVEASDPGDEVGRALQALANACKAVEGQPLLDGIKQILNGKTVALKASVERAQEAKQRQEPLGKVDTIPLDTPTVRTLDDILRGIRKQWKLDGRARVLTLKAMWADATLNSLFDNLVGRNRASSSGEQETPISEEFRNKLLALVKKTIVDNQEFQAFALFYGLDGNGRRNAREIGEHLKVSLGVGRGILASAHKQFHGAPGVELLHLVAKETGTELLDHPELGFYTYQTLAQVQRDHRNHRSRENLSPRLVFGQIPLDVVPLSEATVAKLKSNNLTRLDQVVEYFRTIFFEGTGDQVPYSKAELTEIYDQIQPIFWPDRRNLSFLDRVRTTEPL